MSNRETAEGSESFNLGSAVVHYSINTTIEDKAFNPDDLLECLGREGRRNEDLEQSGRWSVYDRIVEPNGFVSLIVEGHGEEENFHYHLLVIVDFYPSREEVDGELLKWSRVIECLGQTHPGELQCSLITRAEFDAQRWETVLSLPRAAGGLVPEMGEDEIVLSGVELNFSRTDLPLDELFVSSRDEEYLVAVRYQRKLKLQTISGIELLREADNLAKSFVIEKLDGGEGTAT